MNTLKLIQLDDPVTPVIRSPAYILNKHLSIDCSIHPIKIDLNDNFLNNIYSPELEILTCYNNIQFSQVVETNDNKEKTSTSIVDNNSTCPNIQTLRLVDFTIYSSCDICNNEKVIESCNLHNSLKNLVLDVKYNIENQEDERLKWRNVISTVLKKEHYYNLRLVNLLLHFDHDNTEWFLNY